MKNVQIILFLLLSSFSCTQLIGQEDYSVDLAQASETVKKMASFTADTWKNKLMLSVNQKKFMIQEITGYEMKKISIFKSNSDMDTKNVDLKALDEKHRKGMIALLSPEQNEKYLAEIKLITGQ